MAFGHLGTTPHVLVFQFEPSIEQMIREMCVLEGIETKTVTTAKQAFDFLASADADHWENGRRRLHWVVLIDNLQVSYEGNTFLTALRDRAGLRVHQKLLPVLHVLRLS